MSNIDNKKFQETLNELLNLITQDILNGTINDDQKNQIDSLIIDLFQFEENEEINLSSFKKKYHKISLETHPDKNQEKEDLIIRKLEFIFKQVCNIHQKISAILQEKEGNSDKLIFNKKDILDLIKCQADINQKYYDEYDISIQEITKLYYDKNHLKRSNEDLKNFLTQLIEEEQKFKKEIDNYLKVDSKNIFTLIQNHLLNSGIDKKNSFITETKKLIDLKLLDSAVEFIQNSFKTPVQRYISEKETKTGNSILCEFRDLFNLYIEKNSEENNIENSEDNKFNSWIKREKNYYLSFSENERSALKERIRLRDHNCKSFSKDSYFLNESSLEYNKYIIDIFYDFQSNYKKTIVPLSQRLADDIKSYQDLDKHSRQTFIENRANSILEEPLNFIKDEIILGRKMFIEWNIKVNFLKNFIKNINESLLFEDNKSQENLIENFIKIKKKDEYLKKINEIKNKKWYSDFKLFKIARGCISKEENYKNKETYEFLNESFDYSIHLLAISFILIIFNSIIILYTNPISNIIILAYLLFAFPIGMINRLSQFIISLFTDKINIINAIENSFIGRIIEKISIKIFEFADWIKEIENKIKEKSLTKYSMICLGAIFIVSLLLMLINTICCLNSLDQNRFNEAAKEYKINSIEEFNKTLNSFKDLKEKLDLNLKEEKQVEFFLDKESFDKALIDIIGNEKSKEFSEKLNKFLESIVNNTKDLPNLDEKTNEFAKQFIFQSVSEVKNNQILAIKFS